MKKVLISGYIGFGNFGDEAIFKILKEHLRSLNCEVFALSANNDYDIKTYNYKSVFEILKAILNCDILISGGGSLLQNKTSNFSLIYYLLIIFSAKFFGKKVIVFAQGIEPINGKFFELLTMMVLKLCDFVSVRDIKSQDYLKTQKIQSVLLSDPVYSIAEKVKPLNNKKGTLLQLRDYKGIDKDFINRLAKTLIKYTNQINVLALQKEYDEEKCKEFINEFKKFGGSANYIYNKDTDKNIDVINAHEFVISARLHGLIVSTALESKTFALSYDEKTDTIVNELNLFAVNIFNYDAEELDEKLKLFFNSNYQRYNFRKFDWELFDRQINDKD